MGPRVKPEDDMWGMLRARCGPPLSSPAHAGDPGLERWMAVGKRAPPSVILGRALARSEDPSCSEHVAPWFLGSSPMMTSCLLLDGDALLQVSGLVDVGAFGYGAV